MVDAFTTFPHLLEPLKIGSVVFRNRMFSAPTGHADIIADGQPSIDALMVFERVAIGGAAMVAEGEVCVDPKEWRPGTWPREIVRKTNYNFHRVASTVTRHGSIASMELTHAGSGPHPIARQIAKREGRVLEGPSDCILYDGMQVKAMTEERIYELIEDYGKAALAAKNAGFGMVALHAAHGRAFQHWFSPEMNHRTDMFGGNAENRCRFPVMVVDEIHRVCGRDFPVEVRISGTEFSETGYKIDEGCRIAEQLDGHADIINVSVGNINSYADETLSRTHLSMFYPQGRNAEYSEAIKKHVSKSYVGIAGGFSDPYFAEETLAEGRADIIYMARELVCDPDMPNKVRMGRPEEIRKCMRCLQCFSENRSHGDMACAINPEAGRERENMYAVPPQFKQNVLVIGGGIAGMQAALTAHKYGHTVTLVEKSNELGGTLLCERNVSFKSRMHEYIEQQKDLIAKAGIKVYMNTEATPEFAKSLHPDAIFAALGAVPTYPPVKGVDGPNVYQAKDVFTDPSLAKGKVVILGAGLVGTELAIYLKEDFKTDLDIVEMGKDINPGTNHVHKHAIKDMVNQHKIPIHFNTKALEITDKGVLCQGPEGEIFYEADTVVVAAGMKGRTDEAMTFEKCAPIFYLVGDCRKPSNVIYATSTAYTAARYLGRFSEYYQG